MTVRTKSAMATQISTLLADNTSGDISEADVRSIATDLKDSASFVSSGAGAPASTPGAVGDIYIDTTNDIVYVADDVTGSGDWQQIVGSAATQTLTGKTLTAPVLGGTVTGTYTLGGTPTLAASIAFDADGTRNIGDATNRAGTIFTDAINLNGTTLSGTTLADPGADRILFWDDSASTTAYLTASTGLAISTTSLAVTGVLEDLVTLGANSADGEFLVGTGAGALAWESGATARASLGLVIGTDVQAFDADTLKADTADQLTAGFTAAIDDDGTQSTGTYTPDEDTGNFKRIQNAGAFTLAPPTVDSGEATSMTILIECTTGAGTVTTSGFTKVTGDSLASPATTDEFMCFISVMNQGGTTYSVLNVVALQ